LTRRRKQQSSGHGRQRGGEDNGRRVRIRTMTKETEKKGILVFILCGTVFYLTVPNFISKGTVLDNSLTAMVAYLRPLFFELRKIVVSSPILAASASQR